MAAPRWKSSAKAAIFLIDFFRRRMGMLARRCYQFGRFRLDVGGRALFGDGKPIALTPKAVDVLIVLVEARNNPVSKAELLQKVWGAAVVEEGSLTSHISVLRKALGEHEGRACIETLPKRGY